MSIRLTGISTPVGGISWEYLEAKDQPAPLSIVPDQKIKVFISSICGVEKYDKVRAELKESIEGTKLAEVYAFEAKGASSLPAGAHYSWALEDSDICIFLIDNADGIRPGVQAEIDIVNKYNIKALYYFCDESSKVETALQQSLKGAQFAKSRIVHSFSELSQDGARELVEEIIAIYHYYCTGRIVLKSEEDDELERVDISGMEKYQLPTIPKTALKNVVKCRDYIMKFVLGYCQGKYFDGPEETNELDDWGLQFLQLLFEGRSIKHFNTSMYLGELKAQQDDEYYKIVQIRWHAIQAYFVGDIEKCIECLEKALSIARNLKAPSWVIKDILVDLRNQHWIQCTIKNEYSDTSAQKELTESDEELYYPILDRIHESLHEKYIEGLYKQKTGSPYSVTIGSNLNQYGEMIASSLIVSMYNGSLTHILLIYERIRDFAFYLSCKYDDWNIRLCLYKLAIFAGKEKEIKGIQDSYPEILNSLTSNEAESIMEFCLNHPVKYKRESSQLLAFGAVGYFLNDKKYESYESLLVGVIKDWLSGDNSVVFIGQNIFKCLSGVAYRISQDILGEICCQFIDKHFRRWYIDMFKFIGKYIDLRKMSDESAESLVGHIIIVMDNEKERDQISYAPSFLCILRKQNWNLTNEMEKKIAVYFPKFYNEIYKLETTKNVKQDIPRFVQEYVDHIQNSNETQGKNGVYYGHGTRYIATVRAILLEEGSLLEPALMDRIISAVADTLLISKESISVKLDALALLICIIVKYPEDFVRNQNVYEYLYSQQDQIEVAEHYISSSNIDSVSLKIGLLFLYTAMGKDVYKEILELMPYIKDDVATTVSVSSLIAKYLEIKNDVVLPTKIESIVLQNVLLWLQSDFSDIRWNATRILLTMTRNRDNYGIVNHQLVDLIDSKSVYIKNLILRNLNKMEGITDETKKHVISKCKNDVNYVVRMVCSEVVDNTLDELCSN